MPTSCANGVEGLVRLDDCFLMATHNSYRGGPLGSIRRQLDSGVRCVELDVHVGGELLIGHAAPGDGVSLDGGNPGTLRLDDWITAITAWSRGRAGHAPIIVVLDTKTAIVPTLPSLGQAVRAECRGLPLPGGDGSCHASVMTAARKLEPVKPASLDDESVDPFEHGDEWEAEIQRRIEDQRAGRGKSIPLDEVVADIRAKYGWE